MIFVPNEILTDIIVYATWRPMLPQECQNPILGIWTLEGHPCYDPSKGIYDRLSKVSPRWRDIVDTVKVWNSRRTHGTDTITKRKEWIENGTLRAPILQHLGYYRGQMRDDDAEPKPVFALPNLKTLLLHISPRFRVYNSIQYDQWFLPSLQTLDLDLFNPYSEDVEKILLNVGPTLITLSWNLYTLERGDYIYHPLPEEVWTWCPNLRNIRVDPSEYRRLLPPTSPRPVSIYLKICEGRSYQDRTDRAPWAAHIARWAPAVQTINIDRAWSTVRDAWRDGLEDVASALEGLNMALLDIYDVPFTVEEVQTTRREQKMFIHLGWGPL